MKVFKLITCLLIGHKISRLIRGFTPIEIQDNTSLSLRVDYCSRCGLVHGRIIDRDFGAIETIEVLTKEQNESI